LRSQLKLTVRQFQVRDRVTVHNHPREHAIEFGFNYSGCVQDEYGNQLNHTDNILVGGLEPGGIAQWEAKQPLARISIHIEPELLAWWVAPELECLPKPLQRYLMGSGEKFPYFCVGYNTSAIQMALSQIFNCPYHGITRRIYLESKVLELITLKLAQMREDEEEFARSRGLKSNDIDLMIHAKEVLLKHMDQPPSLLELARQLGINDRKLKEGFREVFGTTVFGYLQDHRLEQACLLLQQTEMSVTQIARQVGYTTLSAFSTAFRKKYGINPRAYARSANPVRKSFI